MKQSTAWNQCKRLLDSIPTSIFKYEDSSLKHSEVSNTERRKRVQDKWKRKEENVLQKGVTHRLGLQ